MGTRFRLPVVVLALGLLVAGCPEEEPAADEDTAGDVTVEVTAPSDGEEVELPFDLELDVSGVTLGEPETGEHHLHVYVGDADFETHFSDEPFTVPAAAEGEQPIRVVLARANHDELDASDEVNLTVGGEPAEQPDEDDEDDDPGVGY